ncbi:hypothetical protein [Mycolicibacterium llatzerense]|uniref:hypothetical protein n=1 Tax=Mycolicibacterium llatzerense TaxID=280871 RepID=UPI000A6AF32E|nr:hypothetical protein [Mycolicibacterium llatzerense]
MTTKSETLTRPDDLDDETANESVDQDGKAEESQSNTHAATDDAGEGRRAGRRWSRVIAFGLLPAAVLILAAAVGFVSYRDHSAAAADAARSESVQAATESSVALLSYRADTADTTLNAARDRLTGAFRDSYSSLIRDVVIPGAKQKRISSIATVPAAASVSASSQHAVVLLFVNQSIIVGSDAPTSSTSCVKVNLDKVGNRWLISQFEPI